MNKSLVVIVGPTAVGKTDLSIDIAKYLSAPIISCDSRQFYRELSIGTAAPTAEQLGQVPHHFVHCRSVAEDYTAGVFENDAIELLGRLFESSDFVVMTGGSGLYVDAVCNGIDAIEAPTPELREQIRKQYAQHGVDSLANSLKELDPIFYQEVDRANHVRLMRALEVCITTGKPYSQQRIGQPKSRNFDIIKIVINRDRAELYSRINQRVDMMIEQGLEREVRSVVEYRDCNSLNTVGYKEMFDYIDGNISLAEAIELIKRNSRRYAKRQLTWFRRYSDAVWFEPTDIDKIVHYIKEFK